MNLPSRVKVVEVGPRDGLQNEAVALPVEERIAFCLSLIEAGLPVVEPGAFVSPRWVPQMAGSDEVFKALPAGPAQLLMLVPNLQGYERAKAAGVSAIAIFTAASDAFNLKNTNATMDESLRRFEEFVGEAKSQEPADANARHDDLIDLGFEPIEISGQRPAPVLPAGRAQRRHIETVPGKQRRIHAIAGPVQMLRDVFHLNRRARDAMHKQHAAPVRTAAEKRQPVAAKGFNTPSPVARRRPIQRSNILM